MSQWLMFSAEAQMSEKPFSDGLPEAFRRASGCFFEKSSIPEPIFRAENCGNKKIRLSLHPQQGGLAQLARALAWHARGHEFESRILHHKNRTIFRWSRFSTTCFRPYRPHPAQTAQTAQKHPCRPPPTTLAIIQRKNHGSSQKRQNEISGRPCGRPDMRNAAGRRYLSRKKAVTKGASSR